LRFEAVIPVDKEILHIYSQIIKLNSLENGHLFTTVLHFMKYIIITGIMASAFLLSGCDKKNGSPDNSTVQPSAQAATTLSSLPILQPALTAYMQGDTKTVVSNFLVVDWSARPLFASGSALNLTENQLHALSEANYHAKSTEVTSQLLSLKALATAVAEAGRDEAKSGDAIQARKDFMSVKQFGTALDNPDHLKIVQLVGQAYKKMSDADMAKIGK
jgi:hypothetical protein